MAVFPGGDKLHIIYEGPPKADGSPGDRFFLSGDRKQQAAEGVELARGVSGLLRAPRDYRYDTSANQPGSTFVDAVANRRIFNTSINVFGDTPAEWRAAWRKWAKNNKPRMEGKLWFKTSDAPARYAFVRPLPEAGQSSIDIDPNILSKLEGLEWGWESDYAYLFGETQKVEYDANGTANFYNPSDVDEVYPKIYLPGPGSYTVSGVKTPNLTEDEVARINFDPERKTYVKRNMVTGEVVNLWYTLIGKRPEWALRPEANNSHSITPPTPGTKSGAYIEFTPLYEGAF